MVDTNPGGGAERSRSTAGGADNHCDRRAIVKKDETDRSRNGQNGIPVVCGCSGLVTPVNVGCRGRRRIPFHLQSGEDLKPQCQHRRPGGRRKKP